MVIKIFCFRLSKVILMEKIISQTCKNAKRRSWNFSTTQCDNKLKLIWKLTKIILISKEASASLKISNKIFQFKSNAFLHNQGTLRMGHVYSTSNFPIKWIKRSKNIQSIVHCTSGQVLKYFKYFKIETFQLKYLILKHF